VVTDEAAQERQARIAIHFKINDFILIIMLYEYATNEDQLQVAIIE
jgi:hypothetical protein